MSTVKTISRNAQACVYSQSHRTLARCRLYSYRHLALVITIALAQNNPLHAADWIGSASCSSSTCHGGTVGRGPAWNHSYSVSRSADPHVTAGRLLYDDDSRRIVLALDPAANSPIAYDLTLRKRCISCHLTATPQDIASTNLLPSEKVGEGVSCESCHGRAGGWRDSHLLTSWTGPERYGSTTGMLDTESILGRAVGCVRCHVGSRTADGIVRDMNHDLIAAGHPALRFDLLIYNQNMPPHWNLHSDTEQNFNLSATRVRSVGRSIGLAAAARLSSERAAASQANVPSEQPSVPWPELSDFDCFACHQSLSPRSYRLPTNVEGKPPLQISDGLPLWNSWFTAMPARKGNKQLYTFKPKPGSTSDWIKLANEIAELYSNEAVQAANSEPTTGMATIESITKELNVRAPADWNAAAAVYLDLEAALHDLAKQPSWKRFASDKIQNFREKVLPLLLFNRATDLENTMRLRSPQHFDPIEFRSVTKRELGEK